MYGFGCPQQITEIFMDQQRPLPEYSAVPPPSLSSEYHPTDVLCLPEKFPLPPSLFLLLFLSFLLFFSRSCLSQQASRCFLPSAALLCPSQPPISRLRKEKKEKQTKKLPPASQPQGGSTNMPLFGRVHECKEYEYWNEKKVWIVSVTKWTLSKNKRDPQKDTSKIRTHSSQQMNTKALTLKEKRISKRL